MFYQILKHGHSGLRWIVLFFVLATVINSGIKYFRKKDFNTTDKRLSLIAVNATHLQLLLGIILFFISPKVVFAAESFHNTLLRFFLLEHTSMMLAAVILITIGYSSSKKAKLPGSRHLRLFLFYGLGLLLILAAIPWPWRMLSGGWI